jgi:hypothetical protein
MGLGLGSAVQGGVLGGFFLMQRGGNLRFLLLLFRGLQRSLHLQGQRQGETPVSTVRRQ